MSQTRTNRPKIDNDSGSTLGTSLGPWAWRRQQAFRVVRKERQSEYCTMLPSINQSMVNQQDGYNNDFHPHQPTTHLMRVCGNEFQFDLKLAWVGYRNASTQTLQFEAYSTIINVGGRSLIFLQSTSRVNQAPRPLYQYQYYYIGWRSHPLVSAAAAVLPERVIPI